MAGDCGDCKNPPTFPGNASRCQCEAVPTIVATFTGGMDTIDSSHPVTLSANGGCPPYTWSTLSKGYSLIDNRDRTMTLSVISGTCSVNYDISATIIVKDSCQVTPRSATIKIRNTAGMWKTLANDCYDNRFTNSNLWTEVIDGNLKYVIRYVLQDISSGNILASAGECRSVFSVCTDCESWLDDNNYKRAMSDGHCKYWRDTSNNSCWYIGTYENNTKWGYTTLASRMVWSCP